LAVADPVSTENGVRLSPALQWLTLAQNRPVVFRHRECQTTRPKVFAALLEFLHTNGEATSLLDIAPSAS
jgi:hypothetical protein